MYFYPGFEFYLICPFIAVLTAVNNAFHLLNIQETNASESNMHITDNDFLKIHFSALTTVYCKLTVDV